MELDEREIIPPDEGKGRLILPVRQRRGPFKNNDFSGSKPFSRHFEIRKYLSMKAFVFTNLKVDSGLFDVDKLPGGPTRTRGRTPQQGWQVLRRILFWQLAIYGADCERWPIGAASIFVFCHSDALAQGGFHSWFAHV